MIAADEGHSLSQKQNKLQFAGRTTRFLEQQLDLEGPTPQCKALAMPASAPALAPGKAPEKAPPAKTPAKAPAKAPGAKAPAAKLPAK